MNRHRAGQPWRPALALLLLGGLVASACVSTAAARRELDETTFRYNRDLRWQRFSQAARHVDPKLREKFLDRCTEIEGRIDIESIELVDIDIDEENTAAIVRVRYGYVLSPSMSLQSKVIKQRWTREGGTWTLVEGAWPAVDE